MERGDSTTVAQRARTKVAENVLFGRRDCAVTDVHYRAINDSVPGVVGAVTLLR